MISLSSSTPRTSSFPDIFSWIQKLAPNPTRKTNLPICSSSLLLTVDIQSSGLLTCSITAEIGVSVPLWTSKPFKFLDENALFINLIEVVLSYGAVKNSFTLRVLPQQQHEEDDDEFKNMFNLVFLTLTLLVCVYEAPMDLRSTCLNTIKNNLADCRSRHATKCLMKLLGSNLEEQWMRAINLAITNWIHEKKNTNHYATIKTPSPLYSYAVSTFGLWKVHLYCPVIAMDTVHSSHSSSAPDHEQQRLLFSLNYHQMEGVIQFNYKARIQKDYIDVMVNIDNVRYQLFLQKQAFTYKYKINEEKKYINFLCLL